MKLATFRHGESQTVGLWNGTDPELRPLRLDGHPVHSLLALIRAPGALARCSADSAVPVSAVELLAPIPKPSRNIFCIGKNYRNHAQEFSRSGFDASSTPAEAIPEYPIIFTKPPETVIGTGAGVWSAVNVTSALDYEAELAVIIGRGGRGIAKADALDHVWGYTIINDVTARDWQRRHKQWFLGKSFDTFCPMGPLAVTADEIDSTHLEVRCWINGELRQHANTRDLIFDVATIIETISAGITLLPGDIIATGTPREWASASPRRNFSSRAT